MARLFVLTASNPEAYQHYIDTLERGFSLDFVSNFLAPDEKGALEQVYGGKEIHAWGATPGPVNITTWGKLQIGDPILVYRKGYFEYYAFVTYKVHNPALAKHLWGVNAKGETWEYVYFLDKVTEISSPARIYNEALGYEEIYRPQGFYSIQAKRIEGLVSQFGSVAGFLNYLGEGKWIKKEKVYPKELEEKIIEERITRQMGNVAILEANLENILVNQVEAIEPGLKLIGRQIDTKEVGRLDLLCEDRQGDLVVVELKRGSAGTSIIDQIQRYMGWAIKHRAKPNQKVRGIIVVAAKDTALEYAVRANPLMQVKAFTLSIQ